MSNRIVIHHAHHPEENLYRLIHVQADKVKRVKTNPELLAAIEAGEKDLPAATIEEDETVYSDPQEIVWSADDERWANKTPEEIVRSQRTDVIKAMKQRERWIAEGQKKENEKVDLPRINEPL